MSRKVRRQPARLAGQPCVGQQLPDRIADRGVIRCEQLIGNKEQACPRASVGWPGVLLGAVGLLPVWHVCSNVMMDDGDLTNDLPVWWPYPSACAHGHPWGPGKIIVAFRRCICVGIEPGKGHTVVYCRASRMPGPLVHACARSPRTETSADNAPRHEDLLIGRGPACEPMTGAPAPSCARTPSGKRADRDVLCRNRNRDPGGLHPEAGMGGEESPGSILA